MTYYWKYKNIPQKCPKCGEELDKGFDTVMECFTSILGYTSQRVKHPFWRMKCYTASCFHCLMMEELVKKDYLLKRLEKHDPWRGASIQVPFGV